MAEHILSIDTETTGLVADKNEVCQIGFVLLNADTLEEEYSFSEYLRCTLDVYDERALVVNGLDARFLKDYHVEPEEILGLLMDYAELPVLGHNLQFDLRFLRSACERHGRYFPMWEKQIDTQEIAKKLKARRVIGPKSMRLNELAEYFGIQVDYRGLHDALYDARLTGLLYKKLKEYDWS